MRETKEDSRGGRRKTQGCKEVAKDKIIDAIRIPIVSDSAYYIVISISNGLYLTILFYFLPYPSLSVLPK